MHASDSAAMPHTVRTNKPIGSKLRIVFMGSPEFAILCLDRLAKLMKFVRSIASLQKNQGGV